MLYPKGLLFDVVNVDVRILCVYCQLKEAVEKSYKQKIDIKTLRLFFSELYNWR